MLPPPSCPHECLMAQRSWRGRLRGQEIAIIAHETLNHVPPFPRGVRGARGITRQGAPRSPDASPLFLLMPRETGSVALSRSLPTSLLLATVRARVAGRGGAQLSVGPVTCVMLCSRGEVTSASAYHNKEFSHSIVS